MKTKFTTNFTQVMKRVKSIEQNANYVQKNMQLSEFDYKEFIFELGLKFLEIRFRHHNEMMVVATMPRYWKWFKNEYHLYELEYLDDVKLIHLLTNRASKLNYFNHQSTMLRCNNVDNGFLQFMNKIARK